MIQRYIGQFFLLSAIESENSPSELVTKMQNKLVWKVLESVDRDFVGSISFEHPVGDICDWIGIHCTNGIMNQIRYTAKSVGNFDLAYVPGSVVTLSLFACNQHYYIETRYLPRKSKNITLERNMISGTVNLTTLPYNLQVLNLRENKIMGPIDLTNLPPRLHVVDLSKNSIRQAIIYYDNIPRQIQRIALWSNKKIEEIRPAPGSENIEKSHIFQGIERSCIF